MPIVSSHILDSVSGQSAPGIRVQLIQILSDKQRSVVFDIESDHEGRISETINLDHGEFELIFYAADYFSKQPLPTRSQSPMQTVVLRFNINDGDKRYHLPVMLAPHSYSVWCSD